MILSQDNNKNYYPESVPIRFKILHQQVEIQKTPKWRFFVGRTGLIVNTAAKGFTLSATKI
ncbi:MAG: hypothetical protein Q8Q67_01380 [bacterium]|nr:hypothetical protein [bacterium]